MNTAVCILCRLYKFHNITDLMMNHHWLPISQWILFEVRVLSYHAYFLYFIAQDLRSNNKLLTKPCQSVFRIKKYDERSFQHAVLN